MINQLKRDLISAREMKKELKSILNWWEKHMIDQENGGFYGRLDGFGKLYPTADKGVILNTRILWTFSAANRLRKNSGWQQMADRAFAYVSDHFIDDAEGGVFWSINYLGEPVDTKKEIYAQSFAIYAFSEYYLLTGNQNALQRALAIFDLIQQHSYDPEHGGYLDAFTRDWLPSQEGQLSPAALKASKTMNTHLHLMEAFTNLYRADAGEKVRRALSDIIKNFLEKIINHENQHEHLFFAKDWRVLSSEISYGHDIECSWLLLEAAEVLGDEELLEEVKPVCLAMAAATLKEGVDAAGALVYEKHADGHVNTARHWWPQAEAVVGFWNAYQLSGEEKYAVAASKVWQFIKNQLKDTHKGEWYSMVDKLGEPNLSNDKAGPWKAPYHNGRMCMEMIRRLG